MTIKLKNLIPESISPRREESYEDAIRTLIATKYSEAFSQAKLGRKLYRGFRRRTGFNLLSKYYTLDPKTRPRYAKSTNNLYVAFMDTFPQWEKYPKRGLSVICSPELEEAASYGEPYVVLFENETIVSQSNNSDFWDGMPYIEKRTQCSVNKLMDAVEDLMRIFNIHKKLVLNTNRLRNTLQKMLMNFLNK